MKILLISLISCLFSLISSQNLYETATNPLDFEFTGACPSDYRDCIPSKSLILSETLANLSETAIISSLNAYISANPANFSSFLQVFAVNPHKFSLQFSQNTEKTSSFARISLQHAITSKEIEFFRVFPSEKPKKPFDFAEAAAVFGENTHFRAETFRFLTNLLFHVHHIETSPLKTSLKALYFRRSPAPVQSFSPAEISLLSPLDASLAIVALRRELRRAYEYFSENFLGNLCERARKLFLNGRENVSFDDFAEAFFVMRTKAQALQEKKQGVLRLVVVLLPVVSLASVNSAEIQEKELRFADGLQDFHYKVDEELEFVEVFLEKSLLAGENLQLQYKTGNSLDFFMFFGEVPKKNPNDCLEFVDFKAKIAKMLENIKEFRVFVPRNECLRRKDLKSLYLLYNLANLQGQSFENCKEKLKSVRNNKDSREFFEKIDSFCEHPVWENKKNLWAFVQESLENGREKCEVLRNNAIEYINYREMKGLRSENGRKALEYIERKREIIEEFGREVKNLKKYSKKMRKISAKTEL